MKKVIWGRALYLPEKVGEGFAEHVPFEQHSEDRVVGFQVAEELHVQRIWKSIVCLEKTKELNVSDEAGQMEIVCVCARARARACVCVKELM